MHNLQGVHIGKLGDRIGSHGGRRPRINICGNAKPWDNVSALIYQSQGY